MGSGDQHTGNNRRPFLEASPGQTAAHAASVARVLAPLCRRAGLHTLATLFEMAEQEARDQPGKTLSAPQGEGVSWDPLSGGLLLPRQPLPPPKRGAA
jgi:hypothetical protein